MIVVEIILLIIGFILLVKGADGFVDGCSNLASAIGIPSLIIGLTVVAFGTSAPELAVSAIASLKVNSAISVGNVVGSNICNMFLVLGATSLFGNLHCKRKIISRDFIYLFLSYITLFIISLGTYLNTGKGYINRVDGLLLLCFLAIYIYSLIVDAKGNMKKEKHKNITFKDILFIIISLFAIIGGGELVVNSAKAIAKFIGISDSVIALTVVAIGTSLPELVTSIVSIKKGEDDIAIGNVIGSNIFNILMILGVSSTINTLTLGFDSLIDMIVMLFGAILVFSFNLKDQKITKNRGIILLIIYFIYVAYLFVK